MSPYGLRPPGRAAHSPADTHPDTTEPAARADAAPALGTWTAAGDLPASTYWASPGPGAVTLADGRVLMAGGENRSRDAQNATVLFDPATAAWKPGATLSVSRRLHSLTRLADGKVLAAGGLSGPYGGVSRPGVTSAEILDPATGAWAPTGAMHEARFAHSATLLPDGRVLVAGGIAPRSALSQKALTSAELFDPATGEWTATGPLHDARCAHQAVLLRSGQVLMVGGMTPIGRGLYAGLSFCELYDPARGLWTPTGDLDSVRKGHQATLLADGTVLVTGGDSPGMQKDWTYNPYSQWTAERYDPARGTWSAAEGMSTGRSHHQAVLLRSGKLLVIGGTDDSTFDVGYQNAEVYDPQTRTWTATGGMVTGRWSFAAAELQDGGVLVAGGLVRSGAAVADGHDLATATSEIFRI
ncbi:kelch repeat-containing protein [Streptomyces sp. NBC_01565]|uniref:Kelch repeat-containing protein n=1 Tax=unclassified Streptomyces TaxID=2593676 RepID=UPI0022542C89|nr:kelch repeat-containing protein [Streptomyces sp. NBC_01565]MCX4539403.1 Kelch-like protein 17 [Streptomyces sp. NBC_01565]